MLRNESLASTQDLRLRGHTHFKNVVRMCLLNFFHINWLAKIFKESSKNTMPNMPFKQNLSTVSTPKRRPFKSRQSFPKQFGDNPANRLARCETHSWRQVAHQAGLWLAGRLSARKLACMVYVYLHLAYFFYGKCR